MTNVLPAQRDLATAIQVFDHALDAAFCARMVQSFDALKRFQKNNGRGVRDGHDDSAWTELDIGPLSDTTFRQHIGANMISHLAHYNAALNLHLPVPASPKVSELIVKRYRVGGNERFQPHFDSIGPVANRYLVFLWYLNDVAEGGETEFVDLGIKVAPKAGRLLMFPPYWMYQHQGCAPISNDKFILSTYFLF